MSDDRTQTELNHLFAAIALEAAYQISIGTAIPTHVTRKEYFDVMMMVHGGDDGD